MSTFDGVVSGKSIPSDPKVVPLTLLEFPGIQSKYDTMK